MVYAEGCFEGTPGPNSDAQSAVYLLAADSVNDLHSAPPNADQPPGPEGCAPDCVVQNMAKKEIPLTMVPVPIHTSNMAIRAIVAAVFSLLALLLPYILILIYLMYQYVLLIPVVGTLTEKLDAQSEILRQMATNLQLAGFNPGNHSGKM